MNVDFKTAKSLNERSLEIDKKALAVIKNLNRKAGQQLSEEEICTLVTSAYGDQSDAVLNDLFSSVYLKPYYVIDFKAKRDESDLLSSEI